ncbi:MAG: hypothetical protein JWM75_467 [Sphingomonas bacterium]|nr:hypothetical protein [Sphingomonas bacterium]
MTVRFRITALASIAALLVASCGGGGGGDSGGGGSGTPVTPPPAVVPASVFTAPAQEALTSAEVGTIIAQAASEAKARGLPSVIAVVDRVGNVLGIFTMTGARPRAQAEPGPGGNFDVQAVDFPSALGAIAKAITSAYLSSAGNAFTTRTASMIIQPHFPPAPTTVGLESGPLFGVQFSSLPCSDLAARYTANPAQPGAFIGPKRSPLGLSADPGSTPLYKNGVVVGGIGVMGDGVYGDDKNVLDVDDSDEEYIALAGSTGFEAPEEIRANRITIDGTLLRFLDASRDRLKANPAGATFAAVAGTLGNLTSVRGYYAQGTAPTLLSGNAYGTPGSGVRRASLAEFNNPDAFILVDGANNPRYPPRGGTDGGEIAQPLTAAETRAVLEEAFLIMSRARGQIRQPLDSRAQVSISVVDTRGAILGLVRGPDAPIFGTDVSLQKARTATFMSGPYAATELVQNPIADVRDRVAAVRTFLNDPAALTGKVAFSDRAGGNLARPYFPDGEVGRPNGPLSRPIGQFSPFSTGLQSALIVTNIAEHIFFVQGSGAGGGAAEVNDTAQRCTRMGDTSGVNRLANGLQIFPGSVPIYRGSTLIGGIGISGDGIDQDDMISFLGLANAGKRLGTIGHADPATRSDRVVVKLEDGKEVRLRYVSCPFAPFIGSAEQNVCQGI